MTGSDGVSAGAEELLRRVLIAEAERIEVRPDALTVIQDRIRTGGSPRSGWLGWFNRFGRFGRFGWVVRPGWAGGSGWAPVAAGAVTLLVATLAAVTIGVVVPDPTAQRDPARPPAPVTVAPTPGPASTAPTAPTASTSPAAPTASTGGGSRAAVAVYHVGTGKGTFGEAGSAGPARPRLYREFQRLDVGDGSAQARVAAAVRRMLDPRGADDPDYRSGWPAGARLRGAGLSGVTTSGATATVDLTGAATHDVPADHATLSVQQLVWTVTAVAGVTGVRLRLDGTDVDRLWDRVDVSGVLRRAPAADVLGLVWLVSPQHGVTVGRTFEVHVAGIVAEATAYLRVRQDDHTVDERVLTLSAGGPAQGDLRVTLTLPPGEYLLQAYAMSLADGSEQHLDDHEIVVR